MDNVNYDELFGLQTETDDTPAADPAAEQAETPAEQQAETPPEQPPEPTQEQREQQSREERSRQAFARRIREAEERGAKAERERVNAIIAEMQISEDTEDGQTVRIDNLDKASDYVRRQWNQRMAAGAMNEADVRHIVQEQLNRQAQPPASGISAEDKAEMDRQLAQIARMDPKMKDLGAILGSELGPAFRQYIGAGDDFVTAFYKAGQLKAAAAQQAAAAEKAKAASKGHLSPTRQRGDGALPVPPDEMALFRELMPGATEAEIQKYYNADRKRFGPK